jgi:hypothetical protein
VNHKDRADGLPWASRLQRRCKAAVEPGHGPFWGRCELAPHDRDIPHALDRGMDTPRWVTGFVAGVRDPQVGVL